MAFVRGFSGGGSWVPFARFAGRLILGGAALPALRYRRVLNAASAAEVFLSATFFSLNNAPAFGWGIFNWRKVAAH
jgi:hypothetical protein